MLVHVVGYGRPLAELPVTVVVANTVVLVQGLHCVVVVFAGLPQAEQLAQVGSVVLMAAWLPWRLHGLHSAQKVARSARSRMERLPRAAVPMLGGEEPLVARVSLGWERSLAHRRRTRGESEAARRVVGVVAQAVCWLKSCGAA